MIKHISAKKLELDNQDIFGVMVKATFTNSDKLYELPVVWTRRDMSEINTPNQISALVCNLFENALASVMHLHDEVNHNGA